MCFNIERPFESAAGDEDLISNKEYDACVERYADIVLRIAINYCRSIEDAEDIVQDVFFKLFPTTGAKNKLRKTF